MRQVYTSRFVVLFRILCCFLFAASVMTVGVAQETEADSPIPVIIDTDMALDDWLAILFLLQNPNVEVLAITVTGIGEAHCEPGIENALGLVMLAGEPDIPITCGSETPMQGEHSFPDGLREEVDALLGLELPENPNPAYDGSAVELFLNTIRESEEKVTVITVGPVNNIAEAFEADSSVIDNIEMIYIMGGAVDVPGNVGGWMAENNFAAEANIYVDPLAASLVLSSGAPITLVPLDATNYVPVTMDFYQRLKENHSTVEAEFVYEGLSRRTDFISSGGYFFWDPLAAAIALDESLATIEERSIVVISDEGSQSGKTLESDEGNLIRVAVEADAERFEQLFLDTLNGIGG